MDKHDRDIQWPWWITDYIHKFHNCLNMWYTWRKTSCCSVNYKVYSVSHITLFPHKIDINRFPGRLRVFRSCHAANCRFCKFFYTKYSISITFNKSKISTGLVLGRDTRINVTKALKVLGHLNLNQHPDKILARFVTKCFYLKLST